MKRKTTLFCGKYQPGYIAFGTKKGADFSAPLSIFNASYLKAPQGWYFGQLPPLQALGPAVTLQKTPAKHFPRVSG